MRTLFISCYILYVLARFSPATQAACLQTSENATLSVPAANIAAGGVADSTNLAGSSFMVSSVDNADSLYLVGQSLNSANNSLDLVTMSTLTPGSWSGQTGTTARQDTTLTRLRLW